MSQVTSIEWTDRSWNPTHGCSKVSPGCAHCYAETLSLRYGQTPAPWTPANAVANVLLKPHKLREPLSGGKAWQGVGAAAAAAGKADGMLVFVNSMSDLFHERVPDEYIADVFAIMACAPRHTFQVLTKRPERMRDLLRSYRFFKLVYGAILKLGTGPRAIPNTFVMANVVDEEGFGGLRHVWLGVSVENRRYVDRVDVLRDTPAAIRFVSAEPLLGPLRKSWVDVEVCEIDGRVYPTSEARGTVDRTWPEARLAWPDGYDGPELDLHGIDWLIIGGESGPGHRRCDVAWLRQLRDACAYPGGMASPALFVKQLGGPRPGTALDDLPEDLRIRDFPRASP